MSAQHTPGPWSARIDDTGGQFSGWPYIAAPDHVDATVVHRAGFKQQYWGELSLRETLANARLIAAAPDMLEALRESVARMEACRPMCHDREPREAHSAAIRAARAAIAKATGGEA